VETGGARVPETIEIYLSDPIGAKSLIAVYTTDEAQAKAASPEDAVPRRKVVQFRTEVPEFSLPDALIDGEYRLEAHLLDTSDVLLDIKGISFFSLSKEWRVDGIATYPARVLAGARVLLSLTMQHPASADPWVRWTSGGTVFAEGLVSEGFDYAVFRSPTTIGSFSVSADIFPSAPDGTPMTASPLSGQAKILVLSGEPEPDPFANGLYSVLYRCEGDWFDSGFGASASLTNAPERPEFGVFEGGFGQMVDRERGLVRTGAAIEPEGSLLETRLVPFDEEGVFFSLQGRDGQAISLVGKNSRYVVLASNGEQNFEFPTGRDFTTGTLSSVSIGVSRGEGSTMVEAYVDGIPVGQKRLPFELDFEGFERISLGGSDDSASYLLDYFSIGTRALLPSPFVTALSRTAVGDVLLALDFVREPFDDPSANPDDQGVRFARGGVYRVTELDLESTTMLLLDLQDPGRSSPIVSFVADGARLVTLRSDGSILAADGALIGRTEAKRILALAMRFDRDRIRLFSVSDALGRRIVSEIGSVPATSGSIAVEFVNPLSESILLRCFAAIALPADYPIESRTLSLFAPPTRPI
jgi:hypothetical protein